MFFLLSCDFVFANCFIESEGFLSAYRVEKTQTVIVKSDKGTCSYERLIDFCNDYSRYYKLMDCDPEKYSGKTPLFNALEYSWWVENRNERRSSVKYNEKYAYLTDKAIDSLIGEINKKIISFGTNKSALDEWNQSRISSYRAEMARRQRQQEEWDEKERIRAAERSKAIDEAGKSFYNTMVQVGKQAEQDAKDRNKFMDKVYEEKRKNDEFKESIERAKRESEASRIRDAEERDRKWNEESRKTREANDAKQAEEKRVADAQAKQKAIQAEEKRKADAQKRLAEQEAEAKSLALEEAKQKADEERIQKLKSNINDALYYMQRVNLGSVRRDGAECKMGSMSMIECPGTKATELPMPENPTNVGVARITYRIEGSCPKSGESEKYTEVAEVKYRAWWNQAMACSQKEKPNYTQHITKICARAKVANVDVCHGDLIGNFEYLFK